MIEETEQEVKSDFYKLGKCLMGFNDKDGAIADLLNATKSGSILQSIKNNLLEDDNKLILKAKLEVALKQVEPLLDCNFSNQNVLETAQLVLNF